MNTTALHKLWNGLKDDVTHMIKQNIANFQKITARELEVSIDRDGMYISGLYYCEFPVHLEIEDYAWILLKAHYHFELYKRKVKKGDTSDFVISYFDGDEEIVMLYLQYQEAGLFFHKFLNASFQFIKDKGNLNFLMEVLPRSL